MIPAETIPRNGRGEINENDGGFKYDIFDTLQKLL
jgi:hypothetical protein